MKLLFLFASVMVIGMSIGCGIVPPDALENTRPHMRPGIYNPHMEGDFFSYHDVNDDGPTVDVLPYFNPPSTRITVKDHANRAMQVVWFSRKVLSGNNDADSIDPGHYTYEFEPGDDQLEQPIGVNVCELRDDGGFAYDMGAPHVEIDVDPFLNGFNITTRTRLQAQDGEQATESSFLYVPPN